MLPSISQRTMLRHLREIAEGYSHKLICDIYLKNEERYVTFPLYLVMFINIFGHNKKNFLTLEFDKGSVNRVICI